MCWLHWSGSSSVPLCQKRRAYNCESGFSVFSISLCFKSIYWLPIGCRSILLKPISFLFLGLLFLSQKSPRLLSLQIDLITSGPFPCIKSLFLPFQPRWQLHPPQGKLINYGWMFDWQRLNDRSPVLTRLPHTENLVPIVLFKTCQIITVKLLLEWRVELAFPRL